MSLSQDDYDRIQKALTAVIESPGEFTDFQVDFAFSNADKLDNFKLDTFWSDKQWAVIEGIEKKMEENDDDL